MPIKSPAAKRLCVVKTPVLYAKIKRLTIHRKLQVGNVSCHQNTKLFFFLKTPLAQTTNEQTSPQGQSVTYVTKLKLQFGKQENNEYHFVN